MYSDWFLILTQNVADLILGIHYHLLSIHSILPCTNVLLRSICLLVLETFIGQLAEEDWYRASEAYPLKDFAGERVSTLCRKLFWLPTEEGRVPCTGNHPYIVLRKIDESCLGSFSGILRGKIGLLTPEASYCDMWTGFHIYNHLKIFVIDFLYETGFCRTILLS